MEFFNEVEYVHDNEDESDPESRHGDKVGPLQHTRWPPVVRRAHSADENYQVQELKKNTDLQLTWSYQMYVGKVSLGFYFGFRNLTSATTLIAPGMDLRYEGSNLMFVWTCVSVVVILVVVWPRICPPLPFSMMAKASKLSLCPSVWLVCLDLSSAEKRNLCLFSMVF